ncbi:hypothetical protein ACMGE7_01410 [Macrococcus equi]|uniref:hypothetical protein n=1 Tax=Macrococcus equi TaxID=3395462 RepID=UPI0039BECB98
MTLLLILTGCGKDKEGIYEVKDQNLVNKAIDKVDDLNDNELTEVILDNERYIIYRSNKKLNVSYKKDKNIANYFFKSTPAKKKKVQLFKYYLGEKQDTIRLIIDGKEMSLNGVAG